jgi:hypothetical protein
MCAVMRMRPRSNAELLEHSRVHLRYELWMFLRLGRHLPEVPDPEDEHGKVVGNALVESFVVHLRNLIMFLYPEKVGPYDITSVDFFPDPTLWEAIRPRVSGTLLTARDRAHREIVHLTTARFFGRPPEKAWPISALTTEVRVLMRLFADHASSDRLHRSVKQLLSGP